MSHPFPRFKKHCIRPKAAFECRLSDLSADTKPAFAALAAAPLCSQGKDSHWHLQLPALTTQSVLAVCGWRGNGREEEGREKKKKATKKTHITADQMGTFHMTKPINHLGGAQVQHSRVATHHFTVYRAQTHGHQSMAPPGPGGEALSSLTGPCLMTS